MLLLVKDSPQGKKCLPPEENSAYREEKKLLTAHRKKSLPCCEKNAYRVVVNLPYHPQLTAVYVGDVSEKAVKETIKKCLPKYMIPQKIRQIDQFPLTKNGKKDRRVLTERIGE